MDSSIYLKGSEICYDREVVLTYLLTKEQSAIVFIARLLHVIFKRTLSQWIRQSARALRSLIRWFVQQVTMIVRGVHRRNYRWHFFTFLVWCFCALWQLVATETFLSSGVFAYTSSALEVTLLGQSLTLREMVVILLSTLYVIMTGALYSPRVRSMLDTFIVVHAFSGWKMQQCVINPTQLNHFRLPQVIARRPSLFTYSFSGKTMIVIIGKKNGHLSAEVTEEVEASRVLTSLADPLLAAFPQEQRTAEEASIIHPAEEERQRTRSSVQEEIYFLITLGQEVRLFLKEGTERTLEDEEERKGWVEVELNNNLYEAIIAYLGTRERDEWILRDNLLNALYGKGYQGEVDTFHDSRRRIQEKINEKIIERFPHHRERLKEEKKAYFLFENKYKKGLGGRWRLTARCRVKGLEDLTRWYQHIKVTLVRSGTGIVVGTHHLQKIEDWRRIGRQLIKRYSNNYLQKHMEEQETDYIGGYLVFQLFDDPFKRWAPTIFQQCREKYVYILEYIASCEEKMWQITQDEICLRNAADLYRECAYAATCEPVNSALGEHALRKCLTVYCEGLGDEEAAEHIHDVYRIRIKKALTAWIPEEATQEVLFKFRIGF